MFQLQDGIQGHNVQIKQREKRFRHKVLSLLQPGKQLKSNHNDFIQGASGDLQPRGFLMEVKNVEHPRQKSA